MTSGDPDLPPDLAAFLRDALGDEAAPVPASFTVSGALWLWTGGGKAGEPAKGSWYFLSITGPLAESIRASASGRTGGWGSVKVEAHIGATRWITSLFPSASVGGYLLPVKASVRKAEKLAEGTPVTVTLALV